MAGFGLCGANLRDYLFDKIGQFEIHSWDGSCPLLGSSPVSRRLSTVIIKNRNEGWTCLLPNSVLLRAPRSAYWIEPKDNRPTILRGGESLKTKWATRLKPKVARVLAWLFDFANLCPFHFLLFWWLHYLSARVISFWENVSQFQGFREAVKSAVT